MFSMPSVASSSLICLPPSPAARRRQFLITAALAQNCPSSRKKAASTPGGHFAFGDPRCTHQKNGGIGGLGAEGQEREIDGKVFCARTRIAWNRSDNARSRAASCSCWP